MAKNSRQKVQKSDFQSQFSTLKMLRMFRKKISLKSIFWSTFFVIDIYRKLQFLKPFIL